MLRCKVKKDAAALAQIDFKESLSSANAQALELLKQAGKIQIKEIEGAQAMSLEELRQSGAISLEDYRQVGRVALEEKLQENRRAMEILRQSGTEANTILANKLRRKTSSCAATLSLPRWVWQTPTSWRRWRSVTALLPSSKTRSSRFKRILQTIVRARHAQFCA